MRIGKLSVIVNKTVSTDKSWYNWTYYKSKFGDKQLWIRLFTREVYIGMVPMIRALDLEDTNATCVDQPMVFRRTQGYTG